MPRRDTLQKMEARKLCGVLSSYKLMDVLYALQGTQLEYRNPRYGTLPEQRLAGLFPEKVSASTDDQLCP